MNPHYAQQTPDGVLYPRMGEWMLTVVTGATQSDEKGSKKRRVPTYPLHALLGGVFPCQQVCVLKNKKGTT